MRPERGLSARALGVGAAVGAAAAASNVYVSLKIGWCLPVMSTAVLVGLALARPGRLLSGITNRVGRVGEWDARELVVLASLASSAAYMAGGANLAAFPALAMLGARVPEPPVLFGWFLVVSVLGTLLAPWLGERILRDLPFPTATATAIFVKAGESASGSGAGRALWTSTLVSGAAALVRNVVGARPTLALPGAVGAYTFGLDTSLVLVGAGGLMASRTAWSTLLGGVLTYGVIAPLLVARGVIAAPGYGSIVRFMVWPAASLLVASAVTELVLDLPRLLAGARSDGAGSRSSYVVFGAAAACVLFERYAFGISWLASGLSLPAALLLAYVAGRAMGETDVVPTKALAPIAQVAFGVGASSLVAPGMVPNMTSAVALHAADTLGSLKLARLLGTPRRQALGARLVGCVIGSATVTFVVRIVLRDPRVLPTGEFPAPAVLVYKSILEVVVAAEIPAALRTAVAAGAAVGVLLATGSRFATPRLAAWLPSGMGLGSGMVLPASNAIAIVLGTLARRFVERRSGRDRAMAVASGAIAGDSLVGVAKQLLWPG